MAITFTPEGGKSRKVYKIGSKCSVDRLRGGRGKVGNSGEQEKGWKARAGETRQESENRKFPKARS